MQELDLSKVRCPLALVLLKQQLNKLPEKSTIKLLFSDQQSMQDIIRYLEKKQFVYSVNEHVIIMTNR